MLRLVFLLLGVFLASCSSQGGEYTKFHVDGRMKPGLSLVPMIDSAEYPLQWDVSTELTASITRQLKRRDRLYLTDSYFVNQALQKMGEGKSFFQEDLSWMKKAFKGEEFVAFVELLEHREAPKTSYKEGDCDLHLSARIRVVDLRKEKPTVVLQEIVHQKHLIPRQFTTRNFPPIHPDEETFEYSPLGMAHKELSADIVKRIEEYILLAKDR